MKIKTNFVICTRNVFNEKRPVRFGSEPGDTTYLEVPFNIEPHPKKHKLEKDEWLNRLMKRAGNGDILIFAHGFNNSPMDAMERHDQLQDILFRNGFCGVIVSFDWPSFDSPFNYEEDIDDAQKVAIRLCTCGIDMMQKKVNGKSSPKIHLLGHSAGACVINEAFRKMKEKRKNDNSKVDQIAFIAGDIPRTSLDNGSPLVSKANRITNYQAPYDGVLWWGDVVHPIADYRAGLVGVSNEVAPNVVNVNTGEHWDILEEEESYAAVEGGHSWYFADDTFANDLVQVLGGKERHFPTRKYEFDECFLVKKQT